MTTKFTLPTTLPRYPLLKPLLAAKSSKSTAPHFLPYVDISTNLYDSFTSHHLYTSNYHPRAQALPLRAANNRAERRHIN